jgi:hypothetical protein
LLFAKVPACNIKPPKFRTGYIDIQRHCNGFERSMLLILPFFK